MEEAFKKEDGMTQEYDKRFQDCVDELMILQRDAEKITQELRSNYQYAHKKTQETADDLAKKMTSVERSLSNIRIASENIAGYMALCEKHADRTRKIFIGAVLGCVIVIAGTLWWSNDVITNLDKDRKELEYLDGLFKGMPDFEKVDGHNYVRIVKGTETNEIKTDNGKTVHGRYAKVWYISRRHSA